MSAYMVTSFLYDLYEICRIEGEADSIVSFTTFTEAKNFLIDGMRKERNSYSQAIRDAKQMKKVDFLGKEAT